MKSTDKLADGQGPDPPARRSYEKPRITFREPLEAIAAACDPGSGGKGSPGPPVYCTYPSS